MLLVTLCAYAQQGYAFGCISLCTYVRICIYIYIYLTAHHTLWARLQLLATTRARARQVRVRACSVHTGYVFFVMPWLGVALKAYSSLVIILCVHVNTMYVQCMYLFFH